MVNFDLISSISLLIIWIAIQFLAITIAAKNNDRFTAGCLIVNALVGIFLPLVVGMILPAIYLILRKSINRKTTCKKDVKSAKSKASDKQKQ